MSDSQSTTDLDAQIEKLEAKLNELLDTVQKSQAAQETVQAAEPTIQTQEYIPSTKQEQTSSGVRMSRQEILAEYEKGYLSRLEENAIAEDEIKRAAAELQEKKNDSQPHSTRGSLPKGF
jgi:uncharacterized small protein (DUF1192 family)